MTRLEIIVYGSPAPQGSKKFVGLANSGRGILAESSKRVRPWRQDVKAAARELIETLATEHNGFRIAFAPIDAALRVRMVFTMPKPASSPKRKRSYPMRMPDLSKLARSTEDALTEAGIWRDDARVVEYSRLAKVFPGEDPESLDVPGVRIVIELYEGELHARD